MIRDLVDDVVVVDEREIVAAMQLIMERMKVRAAGGAWTCSEWIPWEREAIGRE